MALCALSGALSCHDSSVTPLVIITSSVGQHIHTNRDCCRGLFFQCSDAIGWATGSITSKKTGCWFVGGDDLPEALHVLQLHLSPPPPPSSLAPIISGMETFWYQLTQVHLKNRERDCCRRYDL